MRERASTSAFGARFALALGMTRSSLARRARLTGFSALVTSISIGALVVAGCGDASVGSPRGLDFGTGNGGTGHGSNGATGGGAGGGGGTSSGGGGGGSGGGGGGGGGGGTVDSGGGGEGEMDSGAPTHAAAYAVTVDKSTIASELLAQSTLNVTVAPNGFSGAVTLSAEGLPSDVDVAFASPSLMLDGTTSVTTKVTLSTHSSTAPGAIPFSIVATSGTAKMGAPSTLTVNSALTINIPSGVNNLGGTQGNPYRTAFGTYPITIKAPQGISAASPVTVRFYNADSVSHEIHASAPGAGFPHDPGSIAPQSMDRLVRKVTATGTYDFYLHDQNGPSTIGRIIIQ